MIDFVINYPFDCMEKLKTYNGEAHGPQGFPASLVKSIIVSMLLKLL